MKRHVKLSYTIGLKTPLYPGTPQVRIKKVKDQKKGDSCNTYFIAFSNHAGTHIDAPNHFFYNGRAIGKYSQDELIFHKPLLIDCKKDAGKIIEVDDLKRNIRTSGFDLLLIRTGFFKHRNKHNDLYCYKNPCIHPKAAKWLRTNHPHLKAIGIDCISVSSYANRELGRETHRIFLRNSAKRSPILIIEDIYIPYGVKKLDEVAVFPILIENIDSAPCAVIGILND